MENYPKQKLDPNWVKEPITQDTVNWCESFGKYLANKETKTTTDMRTGKTKTTTIGAMSTSQLRKFFGEVKRIEMQYNASDVAMLNPLLAYAVGRDEGKTKIKDFQKEISVAISATTNKEEFKNFVQIFEAIVAYHKMYGGKENGGN